MDTQRASGFTFVEVMLFLAVTGMLAVGVLAGSGVAIGQQRYRDSVNSLKSYLQEQFSEVTSVVNSRGENWTCDSNGIIVDTGGPAGEARGRSECVILGRFVTIDDTGKKITSSSVTAYHIPGSTPETGDIAEIASNYRLSASPINQEEQEVSWGAQVVKQKTTTPMPLSILIVRSPLSGTILTFSAEGVKSDLNSMVVPANMNTARNMCLNADVGTFVGGKRLEVRLEAFASSQGAINIPPESASVCD